MDKIQKIQLYNVLLKNAITQDICVYYQIFGQPLHQAPVVLVNHALTGNSNVAGKNGWWNTLIGNNKVIDTSRYTVIAFNIPGNGFGDPANNKVFNYTDFSVTDIAFIFWQALQKLQVTELYAVIGGSLGGAIAWEMAFLQPKAIKNLIPIATNWKASDWVIANVLVQQTILKNSKNPVHDARLHAMLLYRTPQSLQKKFKNQKTQDKYEVENWLLHHGKVLDNRFSIEAYLLMNHLLKTIGENKTKVDLISFVTQTTAQIYNVAINTDSFFTAAAIKKTHKQLSKVSGNVYYNEIQSIHGHDAFLIEYQQLAAILAPVF